MLSIRKEPALTERNIPFGMVEVRYPSREQLRTDAFRELVKQELSALAARYEGYDRKTVFGNNPQVRFFKKFRKTYPVMMQFESVLFKGRPFPEEDPVTGAAFLMELTTQMLSGTHDLDWLQGEVELYCASAKEDFPGMHGMLHTYPGDFCARDAGGIIFSLIAGTDERTCAKPDSLHVLYPVFGTPDMPIFMIQDAMDVLIRYVRVLSPEAEIQTNIL